MASQAKSTELEAAFSDAEASLRLEGLAPTPFGLDLKHRVLNGELTIELAEAELCAHYVPAPAAVR
jgi:hypothetical protein